MTEMPPSGTPDLATLRLIHDEIAARASRLDASTARLDTKATTLLGFVLASATVFASHEAGGWWKVPAFLAFAIAAYFGVQSMRPREFKDAPEPDTLVEHVTLRTEEAALSLLAAAKLQAFNENRTTHNTKAVSWRRSLVALTVAVALVVVALLFGGSDGGRDQPEPGGQRQQPLTAATH